MGTIGASLTDLISGLESTVSAAPGNSALRLHLVSMLREVGRTGEALAHAEAVIDQHPDHVDAHRAAAAAARALGDRRADAFGRVADALSAQLEHGTTPVAAPAPPPADLPAPAAASRATDDVVAETATPPRQPSPPEATTSGANGAALSTPPADEAPEVDVPAAPAPDEVFSIDPEQIEQPTLTFRNIIGVEDVKRRIETTVLQPLRGTGPARARALGGVLMFGPPGCGKGFFARTIAGELGSSYLAVNMAQAMDWPGDPRDNVHRLFAAARLASPCVLFLDDIDLAGMRASSHDNQPDRRLLARLASEIGNAAANRGVFVFAGTTSPWDVDMSLRGDGALERTLLVLPPDAAAREAILRFHLQKTTLGGVDIGWIVQRTQHFSGDDLLLLCERASLLATNDALGDEIVVGPGHMTRALREVRPTAQAWFGLVMEQAMASNLNGLYDDAIAYIDQHQLI